MKAVMKVSRGFGNVELCDIAEPEAGPDQALIEVRAAGICGTDIHIYRDEYASNPPVVLGHEVAGEVVAVGQRVDPLLVGAWVTSETFFHTCGVCRYCRGGYENLCPDRQSIGTHVNGGFTRYVAVPARRLHRLPANVDCEAGALTEPLACVVHAVQLNRTINAGDVAVVAGPGAIGLLAVQVVKAAGATVVVLGTARDARRLELAKELGADYTLNVEADSSTELGSRRSPHWAWALTWCMSVRAPVRP